MLLPEFTHNLTCTVRDYGILIQKAPLEQYASIIHAVAHVGTGRYNSQKFLDRFSSDQPEVHL